MYEVRCSLPARPPESGSLQAWRAGRYPLSYGTKCKSEVGMAFKLLPFCSSVSISEFRLRLGHAKINLFTQLYNPEPVNSRTLITPPRINPFTYRRHLHVFPPISIHFHLSPPISPHFHISPCISTYLHVFPHISMYFHVSPCISIYLHAFPRIPPSPPQQPTTTNVQHQNKIPSTFYPNPAF